MGYKRFEFFYYFVKHCKWKPRQGQSNVDEVAKDIKEPEEGK